jgi:hypothetical protein
MSNDGDKISLKEEDGEVSSNNVTVLPSFDSILTRLSHHADVTPAKTADTRIFRSIVRTF